jgi:hypothetical protein
LELLRLQTRRNAAYRGRHDDVSGVSSPRNPRRRARHEPPLAFPGFRGQPTTPNACPDLVLSPLFSSNRGGTPSTSAAVPLECALAATAFDAPAGRETNPTHVPSEVVVSTGAFTPRKPGASALPCRRKPWHNARSAARDSFTNLFPQSSSVRTSFLTR